MVESRPHPIDLGELNRLQSVFLKRMPDFGDFTDQVGSYWDLEREYKEHLRELVAAELPRALFSDAGSTDGSGEIVAATLRVLTRRVKSGKHLMSQNLVGWRYLEFLR